MSTESAAAAIRKVSLKDLIHPKRLEIEEEKLSGSYGKFVAEPLERGFGTTLGTSLRRILLSSLRGAAITSVTIEGVMHEFSSIPGVLEDVTHMVLNLKEVIVKMENKEEARLRLEMKGPGIAKAGMFTGDTSCVIVNPELTIATLSDGASLVMEVTVKAGRGYVPADRNKVEGAPMGTIFIDSIFSPVRKVNHVVTQARVGQRTDYDKLTVEIYTNGTIDPRTAIAESAHILVDQFQLFVGEGLISETSEAPSDEPKKRWNENLFRRVDELDLSVRSANCLENADIKYIGELVQRTEAEMLRTKNFGRKSLNEIKAIISEMGLTLGMRIDEFPARADLDSMYRSKNED